MAEPIHHDAPRVLADDEPAPVVVEREDGTSPLFLTCDHAGQRIPRALGDLGLGPEELERHIAWDIGAYAVARRLSSALDATLVAQIYSRLVIDCNRQPGTAPSIPEVSEATFIPGNVGLHPAQRRAREEALHHPYHCEITRLLDEREARGQETILVAMHSLTPVYDGVERPWHISFSCDHDRSIADPLLAIFREGGELLVGDNEPYQVNVVDYTLPVHGTGRDHPRVLVELRQDLVADEAGQAHWASRLTTALRRLLEERASR